MSNEQQVPGSVVLSPRLSFILGLVGGVLVLCTLGFFILLGIVLKNGMPVGGDQLDTKPIAAPTVPTPPPAGQPEDQLGTVTPVSAQDHVTGAKKGTVTIITYSDFQCPYCQKFHETMKQVMAEYGSKVSWIFRHLPLSFHENANGAALASECASEQGKFWDYADKMFTNQSALDDASLKKYAADIKLNTSKFNACLDAKKYQSRVDADKASAAAANVNGTPGSIVLGANDSQQLIPGALPLESVKATIEQALGN